MIGNYESVMNVYKLYNNNFLRGTKNLVPRTITYGGSVAFGLVENETVKNNDYFYCFLSRYGIIDRERVCEGDVVSKLSLIDYFNFSERLLGLKLKLNLRKIIYDSNRNK